MPSPCAQKEAMSTALGIMATAWIRSCLPGFLGMRTSAAGKFLEQLRSFQMISADSTGVKISWPSVCAGWEPTYVRQGSRGQLWPAEAKALKGSAEVEKPGHEYHTRVMKSDQESRCVCVEEKVVSDRKPTPAWQRCYTAEGQDPKAYDHGPALRVWSVAVCSSCLFHVSFILGHEKLCFRLLRDLHLLALQVFGLLLQGGDLWHELGQRTSKSISRGSIFYISLNKYIQISLKSKTPRGAPRPAGSPPWNSAKAWQKRPKRWQLGPARCARAQSSHSEKSLSTLMKSRPFSCLARPAAQTARAADTNAHLATWSA